MEALTEETVVHDPAIKLLVVDDREDNLFSIETILDKSNYVIRKATSGRAALKILLKEHDFTLILMDVQMPDLNGFETAQLIYERDILKQIPIIFITANDHGEDNIFKGYQLGGVDYIYKPINPELLKAKVGVFVELYKKNKALQVQEQKLIAANKLLEREIETRKQSELKINLLNKQLIENISQLRISNKELERFAFVASHDLQEPLRKIMIFSDRLLNEYHQLLEEDRQDFLNRIIKASSRMQTLIKNLLDFSRTTSDTQSFAETDLNTLLDGVLADLDVFIDQKKASVSVAKMPVMKVIPEQFRQLFHNLIMNALKFSRTDVTPMVSVSAETIKGMYISGISYDKYDERFHKITVADNGIGFDEKYADQIFMVFKRLHSSDHFEGTGIGLSICKKVAERHNGFIYATGKPGIGATFTIVIPAKDPEPEPVKTHELNGMEHDAVQ